MKHTNTSQSNIQNNVNIQKSLKSALFYKISIQINLSKINQRICKSNAVRCILYSNRPIVLQRRVLYVAKKCITRKCKYLTNGVAQLGACKAFIIEFVRVERLRNIRSRRENLAVLFIQFSGDVRNFRNSRETGTRGRKIKWTPGLELDQGFNRELTVKYLTSYLQAGRFFLWDFRRG